MDRTHRHFGPDDVCNYVNHLTNTNVVAAAVRKLTVVAFGYFCPLQR